MRPDEFKDREDNPVTRELEELGSTPEEVAEELRKRAIRGVGMDGERCALAQAIKRWDGIRSANVTANGYVKVWLEEEDDLGRIRRCDIPEAADAFAYNFDAGEYPDLKGEPKGVQG